MYKRQIIKDRYKITNVKSQLCRFHVQTGGSTLTAQQIDNNITRTTLESLSAVLGGAQSIHTNPKSRADVDRTVETLMGKKPELRFSYLQENARFVTSLDV